MVWVGQLSPAHAPLRRSQMLSCNITVTSHCAHPARFHISGKPACAQLSARTPERDPWTLGPSRAFCHELCVLHVTYKRKAAPYQPVF